MERFVRGTKIKFYLADSHCYNTMSTNKIAIGTFLEAVPLLNVDSGVIVWGDTSPIVRIGLTTN